MVTVPNLGNEHWQLPEQAEHRATKKDYLVLIGVFSFVALTAIGCCGVGFFLGKEFFS